MTGCGAAVLLLLLSLTQTEASDGAQVEPGTVLLQPDCGDELKELRNMVQSLGATVVQQSERLRNMEARVAASEGEASLLRDMVVEQRLQLKNMEEEAKEQRDKVLRLETTVVEQRVQLSNTEARVEASEGEAKVLYTYSHNTRGEQ